MSAFFILKEVVFIDGKFRSKIRRSQIENWGRIVDLLADNIDAEAGFITEIVGDKIRILKMKAEGGEQAERENEYIKEGDKIDSAEVYCRETVKRQEMVEINDARQLGKWQDSLELEMGFVSYLGIPLFHPQNEGVSGTLCVVDSRPRNFSTKEKKLLQEFKHSIENQLENITLNNKLEHQVEFTQSSLDSLSAHIAVIDNEGIIKYTNEAWNNFADNNGASPKHVGEGINYLKLMEKAKNEGAENAGKAFRGIKSLIAGERDYFELEYPCPTPDEKKWFKLRATPFKSAGDNAAVIAHEEITKRKAKVKELQEYKERINDIFKNISDLVWSMSWPDLKVEFVSKPVKELTGYSKEQFSASGFMTRITIPEDKHVHKEALQELKEKGRAEREFRLICKDGSIKWIHDENYIVYDDDGKPVKVRGIMRDITDRKLAEKRLIKAKERFNSLFYNTPDPIIAIDREACILDVNDEFEKTFKYRLENIKGKNIDEVLCIEGKEDSVNEKLTRDLLDGQYINREVTRYDKEGNPMKISLKTVPITVDEEVVGAYGIYEDITARKEKESQLKYKTFHDELTGLHNRKFLAEEMESFEIEGRLPVSIIMIDINGLRIINKTHGHKKGDMILKKAAEILQGAVRDEDILVRYGGDEFVILLPRTSSEISHDICERIEEKCEKTDEDKFPVSMGIGIATKTDPEEDLQEILKQADENMLQNKLVNDKSSQNRMVKGLLNTLGAKSDETKEHAMRMTSLAHRLGERVGVNNSELDRLSLLATLHDIGKTTIPEEVLTKPGELSEEEWQLIREHPGKGYKIASASKEFSVVAEEILAHHERWDGGGYPNGLEGEEIPFLARIISIVDAYDVMTNGRPYKEDISKSEALKEIEECAGSQFDPELAEEFVEMMQD